MDNKLEAMLRLMLDKGASDGEIENASRMFVREARRVGLTFDDLKVALGTAKVVHVEIETEWNWRNYRMPFGKYMGEAFGWIYENDFQYILWLSSIDLRSRRKLSRAVGYAMDAKGRGD